MSKRLGKILILDDDEGVLHAASLFLKQHVATVRGECNPGVALEVLKKEIYDVILLDMNFAKGASGGEEGFMLLKRILEIDPAAVVLLITAFGDVEMAVRAIKEGATDFILKPWQNEKLLATVLSALSLRHSRNQVSVLQSTQDLLTAELDQPFKGFIGTSAAMRRVFDLIQKVAKTEANILILGENGTGKELVARELHRQSARSQRIFLRVDLGSITESLFESELFGHTKGAFTDAKEDKPGRFELAAGGTLFLDEIGNIPLSLQPKLLSLLERREVSRIGSNKLIPIDVRLIAATNMPIYEMVKNKTFRDDLLYRLNTVEISLPPLRQRKEDIPFLTEHFLHIFSERYKKPISAVSASALRKLHRYDWPGNVRELRHTVERAVIMCENKVLSADDLALGSHHSFENTFSQRLNLAEIESDAIRKAIAKHNGNMSEAAKELGLSRASLYRRIRKYGV